MENASKALIIAGAILLAIVIISLGLVVVNNVRNVTDNTNLNEQEIQSFNAKFIAYEGESVSASRVNSLIQMVISTNQATYDSGNDNFVCITFPAANLVDDAKEYIAIGFCTTSNGPSQKSVGIGYAGKNTLDKLDNPINKQESDIGPGKGSATSTNMSSVATGKNYKVEMKYKDKTGLIGGIVVKNI